MPTVTIIEKNIVRPAWPAPEKVMPLTAADIMCREMPHNRRLLFYKLQDVDEYAAVVERLKASLSTALAHFWPLAGRLRHSPGGRLEIECNDAGALFLEARVEGLSWEELQRSDFADQQPLFTELAPWINPPEYALQPPLCVQISRLDCGNFVFGVAHSHAVCDGTSLWNFLTSWAEIARGQLKLSLPPSHIRTPLLLLTPSAEEAFLRMENVEDDETLPESAEPDELLLFQFSRETVRKLKERAGGERSSYEALCAHLWKRASVARGHAPHTKLGFTHIVNMRSRLQPPMPRGYFGNCLTWAITVATAGELQEEDLEATANRIHASIQGCDDKAFKGMLHWLEVNDRSEVLRRVFTINNARLRASSSTWFPVADVDFGWGAPAAVRCPSIEIPGKIIFFPGSEGYGSIDMTLALPSPFIRRLSRDPEFINP